MCSYRIEHLGNQVGIRFSDQRVYKFPTFFFSIIILNNK